MPEEIKYSKPFLKNVIIRVDYTSPVLDIITKLPNQITKKAFENFPILEPEDSVSQGLVISPVEAKEASLIKKEWNFFGKNKDKRLAITPVCTFIDYNKYTSFSQLKTDFLGILQLHYASYPDFQVRRFGLRYINNIQINNGSLMEWESYLNENMLGIFDIAESRENISRAFNQIIINYGDLNLNFQFGMHNPDFPAPISQKLFILDYDAYYQGPMEFADLQSKIEAFHSKIQQIFEASIKDALRDIMR